MYKIVLASVATLLLAIAPAMATEYPDQKQAEIAKTGSYVGANSCKMCHSDVHNSWADSRHTKKSRKGPAFGKEHLKNVYEYVQKDWDKFETHMILDQKDKSTNYVTVKKYALEEVGYSVGSVRKQRYAVYYDGSPMDAYLQTTKDGGISWTIDKSQVVKYPGNKERAGWKFLALEFKPKEQNKNNYGEFYSWQERCISCHTTGFDPKAWSAAKADFVAGKRKDLKDLFVADHLISCEACHGPGSVHAKAPSKGNIINPTKITNVEARKMVCEQCHTRTAKNLHHKGANDLRGYRIGDQYMDHADYVRPAWGKGSRAVSADGKGRRDHQMDMDMRLSETIHGTHSVHAAMSCLDCHDSHKVGASGAGKSKTLKKPALETCAACHKGGAEKVLTVLDGMKGWPKYKYGEWGGEGGRAAPRSHVFNFDEQGRSYALSPSQYHWALKKDGDAKKEADWAAIWPWEKAAFEKKGMTVKIGAKPWEM